MGALGRNSSYLPTTRPSALIPQKSRFDTFGNPINWLAEPSPKWGRQQHRHYPFQQGHLDSLCGVYSILNAVHYLCGPLPQSRYDELFDELLAGLHRPAYGILDRLRHGTSLHEISLSLRSVISPNFPILRKKPFHRSKAVRLNTYWKTLQTFCREKRGVVLIALGGEHTHWTVVSRVTDKTLFLFDSDGIKRLPRVKCCTATDKSQKTHILYPTHTFLLWLETPSRVKSMGDSYA